MTVTVVSINDEMNDAANLAIKLAREKYGQELDFSEHSIDKLDEILGQIYLNINKSTKKGETSKLISDEAYIWGSYLGNYMCIKWGGTWIRKGSHRLVSIINIKCSPMRFIYQKLTRHPEYSLEIYLSEMNKIIDISPMIHPQPSQYLPEDVGQSKMENSDTSKKIINTKNVRFLFISLMGVYWLLFVFVAYALGYLKINRTDITAFGLNETDLSENSSIFTGKTLTIPTLIPTSTQSPTITILSTYPARPTYTFRASATPDLTKTKLANITPTYTQKPITPTRTLTPIPSPTYLPVKPTDTSVPPTRQPPTATVPEPVVIESCEVDPFTVPVGVNVSITFIVNFSSHTPGYGFDAQVDPEYPEQSGCSGTDSDGDGMAFCVGSSGVLPDATTVHVTLVSSVGECVVSYSSR